MPTFPNFLIIGAAKSGTTALYAYLKQHPEIFMCPVKEPKFFAHEGRAPEWRGPGDEGYTRLTVTNVAQYLYMPKARERIKYYVPRARLIAVLRHPAEVAYSAFLHKRREGLEPLED